MVNHCKSFHNFYNLFCLILSPVAKYKKPLSTPLINISRMLTRIGSALVKRRAVYYRSLSRSAIQRQIALMKDPNWDEFFPKNLEGKSEKKGFD